MREVGPISSLVHMPLSEARPSFLKPFLYPPAQRDHSFLQPSFIFVLQECLFLEGEALMARSVLHPSQYATLRTVGAEQMSV